MVITCSVLVWFIWKQRQNVHFSIPYPLIWWQMWRWQRYELYRVPVLVLHVIFSLKVKVAGFNSPLRTLVSPLINRATSRFPFWANDSQLGLSPVPSNPLPSLHAEEYPHSSNSSQFDLAESNLFPSQQEGNMVPLYYPEAMVSFILASSCYQLMVSTSINMLKESDSEACPNRASKDYFWIRIWQSNIHE